MNIREEKGLTGIDIAISIILLTIFISLIGNIIANINLTAQDTNRKTIATSYAVQEIEKIKAQGYIESYDSKGITKEDTLKEEDIYSGSEFTGYNKKIVIRDYVLVVNDTTKKSDIVKEITVNISYKVGNKEKNVKISTYVAKE